MKLWSLEPRFNRANKWNHSTSCSPQHITFRELEEMEKQDVVNWYIHCMLPQTPVFFMNANATPTPGTKQKQNKKHE